MRDRPVRERGNLGDSGAGPGRTVSDAVRTERCRLRATATGSTGGSPLMVYVRGGASGSTWTSSAGWSKLTVPFTTGASGTVTVYVHGWYGQGVVYADDLSVG
ncbi:hypothetical protein [Streptomyces sp. NPDC097981]|uniref:hypothetical protein n=1 Tax=Streptomyces sp. NPDC097981 TaxID=3155428 RepID=UPI0033281157